MCNEAEREVRFTLLLFLFYITKPGAEGVLDVRPAEYTAVLAGVNATLQCSVNRANTNVKWIRNPFGTKTTIVTNCAKPSPPYDTDYDVYADAANGDCNLIIKSTATNAAIVAAQYRCEDADDSDSDEAYFVVLGGVPRGSDNLTDEAVCPGSNVRLSCSVRFYYRGSSAIKLKPTFSWLPYTVREITNTPNSTHVVSSAVMTIPAAPGVARPTCTVQYPAGTNTPYSWSSDVFSGTYYPRNVAISPNRAQFTEGDNLTCSAKTCEGIVTFAWKTTLNVSVPDGQTFTLVAGEYSVTCIASFQPIARRRKRSVSSTYSSNATIHVIVYPSSSIPTTHTKATTATAASSMSSNGPDDAASKTTGIPTAHTKVVTATAASSVSSNGPGDAVSKPTGIPTAHTKAVTATAASSMSSNGPGDAVSTPTVGFPGTTSNNSFNTPAEPEGDANGEIIGVAVGVGLSVGLGLLVLVAVIVIVIVVCRRRKKKKVPTATLR